LRLFGFLLFLPVRVGLNVDLDGTQALAKRILSLQCVLAIVLVDLAFANLESHKIRAFLVCPGERELARVNSDRDFISRPRYLKILKLVSKI
jgi:hypothetical protein